MSSKKFKDLSSFGFRIGKETNSVVENSKTDKENNDTIDIIGETPTDISSETSNVLRASSNPLRDSSNILPASSNALPDSSDVLLASSNVLRDSSNILPASPNALGDSSNILLASSNALPDSSNVLPSSSNGLPDSSSIDHTFPHDLPSNTTTKESSILHPTGLKNDIGNYLSNRLSLSDELRYLLLTQHFVPDKTFKWPFVERRTKNMFQRRFLRANHLEDNKSWLVYSPSKAGLFCVPCVLFARPVGSNQLGQFVLSPCQQYGKLLGNDGLLTRHKTNDYHLKSMTIAERYVCVFEKKCESIDDVMVTKQKLEKMENRKRLMPIIKTIVFCGQNNIPLRGHRDDGHLNFESIVREEGGQVFYFDYIDCNLDVLGNFRALLRYRIDAGDLQLEQHLSTASKTATYISKTTQNELIEICGVLVRESLIKAVKKAKFFTVIGDETTDVSTVEQFTFCLRYVFEEKVHEKFIKFLPAEDRTGEGLARLILNELNSLGLDPKFMVGQAYDGCSAMSGIFNGKMFQNIIFSSIIL